MSKNALLVSVDMIKDRTGIHDNMDPKLVYPEIKTCQDMFILPILGSALYDKIVGDINSSGTTTGNYKTLLDDYIVDALCYYVLSELAVSSSFQMWNKGVIRKVGDNTELPDMATVMDLAGHFKKKAEYYGERLTLYLKQNASDSVLPEYLQPGSGLDTVLPEVTAYTLPIYLGDDNCYCRGIDNYREINI